MEPLVGDPERANFKEMTKKTEKYPNRLIYNDFLPLQDFNDLKNMTSTKEMYWRVVEARNTDPVVESAATDWRVWKDKEFDYDPFEWYLSMVFYHYIEGVCTPWNWMWNTARNCFFKHLKPEAVLHGQFNCDPSVKIPHAQWYKNHNMGDHPRTYSGVLFFNSCNGYVEFDENRAPVKAQENRLVLFRSDLYHRFIPAENLPRNTYMIFDVIMNDLPEGGMQF